MHLREELVDKQFSFSCPFEAGECTVAYLTNHTCKYLHSACSSFDQLVCYVVFPYILPVFLCSLVLFISLSLLFFSVHPSIPSPNAPFRDVLLEVFLVLCYESCPCGSPILHFPQMKVWNLMVWSSKSFCEGKL